jgi:hypothetical protein
MKNPLYRLKSYFSGLDFAKEKHWVTQFSEKGICCHKFFFLERNQSPNWDWKLLFWGRGCHHIHVYMLYIFKSSLEKSCQLNANLPRDAPSGRNWEEKICTGYERLETFCHHPKPGFSAKKTGIPMFGHPRGFTPSPRPPELWVQFRLISSCYILHSSFIFLLHGGKLGPRRRLVPVDFFGNDRVWESDLLLVVIAWETYKPNFLEVTNWKVPAWK